MKKFWEKFYEKPLDQIPWNITQADWIEQLMEEGKIKGKSALDVGCGVGRRSVYLAKKGRFEKVLGVDISEKAIGIAKGIAKEEGVEKECSFTACDVSDKDCLPKDEKFDFVMDWAAIHCIPEERRENYAKNISEHIEAGGILLIRTFSTNGDDKFFIEKNEGMEEKVFLLKEDDIIDLYKDFEIIDKNTSTPRKYPNLIFLELLLRKK